MGRGMYFNRLGPDPDSTSSTEALALEEAEPERDELYKLIEEIRLGMPERITDMEELQVVAGAVALAKQLPDAEAELARIRQLLKESMPDQVVYIDGKFYFLYQPQFTSVNTGFVSQNGVYKRYKV